MTSELTQQRHQELIQEAQVQRILSEQRQNGRQPNMWVNKFARFAENFVGRFKLLAETSAQL